MIRFLCDRCGLEYPAPRHGAIEKEWRLAGSAAHPEDDSRVKLVLSVHVSLRDHPSGYGGPPDLCTLCLSQYVGALAVELHQAWEAERDRCDATAVRREG